MSAVHYLSNSCEWYTPPEYLESVRLVLGQIDLDPASSVTANRNVQAKAFYTLEDDAWTQSWYGRVFLNPPYGNATLGEVTPANEELFTQTKSRAGMWFRKLESEYLIGNVEEAIFLSHAKVWEPWFQCQWKYPIAFTDHRISFVNAGQDAPPIGAAFTYLGTNTDRFFSAFAKHGVVVTVIRNACTVGGSSFVSRRPEAKTCSNPCRQRAYRERKQ